MNINSYVRKYGKFTFQEMPFNEVDGLVLSALAYVNLHMYTPNEGSIRIRDIEVKEPTPFYEGSVDYKQNKMLFNLMKTSKRFRNVETSNIKQSVSHEKDKQFYALTYLLPNGEAFVAYRGTDTSLLGWKEDMYFAYSDNIPSHKDAVNYLNEMMTRIQRNFYVGGHSKGGNLAIHSVLYMNKSLSSRLIKAYSYDGPDNRSSASKDSNYPLVKDKIQKFLTYNDMIGVINNKIKNSKVVYSNGLLLGGHDPFYWFVNPNGKEFLYSRNRSIGSRIFENGMLKWCDEVSDKDKNLVARIFFELLGEESKTIYDVPKNAVHLFKTRKERLKDKFTDKEIEKARELSTLLLKYVTGVKR